MRVRHLVFLAGILVAAVGCARPVEAPGVAGGRPNHGGAPVAPVADEEERRRQFADCMRAEGAELALPGSERRVPPTVGPEADRMDAALRRCRGYLPGGGVPPRPTAEDVDRARTFAKCMRANGVPYYPDPDPETGRPQLTTEIGDRLKHDPGLAAAEEYCRNLLPASAAEVANQ